MNSNKSVCFQYVGENAILYPLVSDMQTRANYIGLLVVYLTQQEMNH